MNSEKIYRRCRRTLTKMAKAGIARGDAEGPQDFATRIAVTRPELAPATDAITRLYVSLRYQEE